MAAPTESLRHCAAISACCSDKAPFQVPRSVEHSSFFGVGSTASGTAEEAEKEREREKRREKSVNKHLRGLQSELAISIVAPQLADSHTHTHNTHTEACGK